MARVVCAVVAIASTTSAQVVARLPVAYGPGVITTDNETWALRWLDEFTSSTNSIGAQGLWSPQFEGWDGYPPATFAVSNVVVNADTAQALLYARHDSSVSFVASDDTCPCQFHNYTASIIKGSTIAPSDRGFVQVRAKLPDAAVRFSIWLQGAGSEVSAFEMNIKGANAQYATSFTTALHTFDQTQTSTSNTLTVDLPEGAADLTASFHMYGVAWDGDRVSIFLDGVGLATHELSGLHNGATSGYYVHVDVSIIPTFEPPAADLPAVARVDLVEVYGVDTLTNYRQLHGAPICDPKTTGSKRSSIRGLSGPGHSLEDCAAGCENTFDCKYFTIRRTGRCYYFEECNVTIPHNDQAYIFERLALPEPPEVDPLAGYESVDPADVTPDGEPQDGVPRVCHGSVGANRADRASLGGGGHTDVACADACTAQDSCKFFVITSSGYCKMWFSCEPTQTKTQSGSVLYKKLQYRMVSLQERCDKTVNSFRSLGGRGHTREACEAGCEANLACAFYNWYSVSGYCHMFLDSCEIRDEAKDGSQFFMRVGGAQIPTIPEFTYNGDEMCDKNGESNVRAQPWSMGGGGHTTLACAESCRVSPTCNYFQRYTSGYCHMWNVCPETTRASRGTLSYSRSEMAALTTREEEVQGSIKSGVALLLGVVAAVGVVVFVRRPGQSDATAPQEATERTHLLANVA